MDESLCVRLSNITSDAIVPLQVQYSMVSISFNDPFILFVITDSIRPYSFNFKIATLQAPSLATASQQLTNQRWLLPVIQPDLLQ
jgi:hypothetical protein